MISTILLIGAVVAILIAGAAVVAGVQAKQPRGRRIGLRVAQIGLTLGGLLLIADHFAGGDVQNLYGGLMLAVLGAGLTDIGGRSDRPPTR